MRISGWQQQSMKLSTDQPGDQTLPQLAASCIPLRCSQQTSQCSQDAVTLGARVGRHLLPTAGVFSTWTDAAQVSLYENPQCVCWQTYSVQREASWVVIRSQGQNFGFPPDKVWVLQVEDCPCWGPNRRTPRGGPRPQSPREGSRSGPALSEDEVCSPPPITYPTSPLSHAPLADLGVPAGLLALREGGRAWATCASVPTAHLSSTSILPVILFFSPYMFTG